MRFEGSASYVATDDLKLAVNAALALGRPLLVKGEPGTGKTLLAETVAGALGRTLCASWRCGTAQGKTREGYFGPP
jgi:MoxR-like ATPase